MLILEPKEMLENPDCYEVVRGKGYVSTEKATEEERKIVEEFNRKYKRIQKNTVVIEE